MYAGHALAIQCDVSDQAGGPASLVELHDGRAGRALFRGVTLPSTFWKRPLASSWRRSADSSEREHTKPGWQLSPAKSSSCAPSCLCHPLLRHLNKSLGYLP